MLLVLRAAGFDDETVERLNKFYELYKGTMFFEALKILEDRALAEDAVIESMLKLAKYLDKFSEIDCPKTRGYIVTIVRSVAIDMLRKRGRLAEVPLDDEIADGLGVDITLRDVTVLEAVEMIKRCIEKLHPNYAEILRLTAFYGHTIEEAADILGLKIDTARKRLTRARNALKVKFKEEGYDYERFEQKR